MTILRAWRYRQKHPLWTWRQCWDYALDDVKGEFPWSDIFVGLAFICLVLVLFSQLLHRYDADNWVCSRASFRAVHVAGQLVPVTPCTEETNIHSGETRRTKWAE